MSRRHYPDGITIVGDLIIASFLGIIVRYIGSLGFFFAPAILLIPVAPLGIHDTWLLHFTRNGQYSVCSDYQFLIHQAQRLDNMTHYSFSFAPSAHLW